MARRKRSPILSAHPREIAEMIRKLRGGLTRRQILSRIGCDPDSRSDYNHICRVIRDYQISVRDEPRLPRQPKARREVIELTKAQVAREIEAYRRGLRAAGKDPATIARRELQLAVAEARHQMEHNPAPPYKPRFDL